MKIIESENNIKIFDIKNKENTASAAILKYKFSKRDKLIDNLIFSKKEAETHRKLYSHIKRKFNIKDIKLIIIPIEDFLEIDFEKAVRNFKKHH